MLRIEKILCWDFLNFEAVYEALLYFALHCGDIEYVYTSGLFNLLLYRHSWDILEVLYQSFPQQYLQSFLSLNVRNLDDLLEFEDSSHYLKTIKIVLLCLLLNGCQL